MYVRRSALIHRTGRLLITILFAILIVSTVRAQSASGCPTPGHKPLTLLQVIGYLDQKVPQDRAIQRIQSCGVSFHLDAAALDRLSAKSASDKFIDALNDVTISQLTLDQSKSEVADLESHINQGGKNVLAYRARATFLQQSTYKDPRESKYVSYNPDTQQMVASLGGEEYLFDKVPPSSAETLVKSWPKVKATQPYTDDNVHTRTLVLEAASISVPGVSRKAIAAIAHAEAEALVAKAKDLAAKHDYSGAISQYHAALAKEPANQSAKDGLAAAETALDQQAALNAQQTEAGVWEDDSVQPPLMWTLHDSEANVNFQGAVAYCQALRWGGYSNWRIPTIDELKAIYDPSVDGNTAPLRRSGTVVNPDGSKTVATPGTTFPVHIKGEIQLTMGIILARGGATGASADVPWGISFNSGQASSLASVDLHLDVSRLQMRALCVRPAAAGETVTNVAHWTGDAPLAPVVHTQHSGIRADTLARLIANCDAGSGSDCRLAGWNYQHGTGTEKDIVTAGKYYKKACDLGSQMGCNLLKRLK